MTKLEAALKYAARGWKVFPCSANTKIPLAGTHGVKDASGDPAAITKWWTEHPDANVGLACGSASGVWVVDIDVRPETGVNGLDSIREKDLKLPQKALIQRTPSGGYHFLFKCDGEKPANKNGFLRGVDIRGDGYYIVVTPSVINGREYSWVDEGAELLEFPEAFKPKKAAVSPVFAAIPPRCVVPSTPILDRARAYLAEIPGAVEHVDGHAKLFWAAQVLVNGFRLSDGEAESLLWDEYNPRCVPPWKRTAATEREFRHKIEEARKKPNPEAVSIYDAMPETVSVDNFDFEACIADVRSLLAPRVKSVAASKAVAKSEAQLNDLLQPEGLVGDIAQWMNETAGCYQPLFSLGASLVLCGALFGRKVCDESNGRTNIYCMGVGHSSCGKDHPGDCINRILTSAGAQSMLMGRMTSDTAIEKALLAVPSKVAVMDEVGHFLSNINKAGDGSAYLKTIKPTLMELFSSAHKTYIGKEKASGNPPVIDQPCMCIWGVTAPQKLYNGMTIEELQDGWIARNLIFISETRPMYVMRPSADVPPGISEAVRAWYTRSVGDPIITATPGGMSKPMVVKMDQSARIEFDRFARKAHDAMMASSERGEKTEYLWGKALQNARRIALIVACGKEYEGPSIGRYEAEYGCNLVEMLIRNAAKSIGENVNENKWEEEKNRIRYIIDKSGMNGITQNELTRKTQWVKGSHERMAYIKDLLESEVIVTREVKRIVGRPRSIYMSAAAAERFDLKEGVEHVEED